VLSFTVKRLSICGLFLISGILSSHGQSGVSGAPPTGWGTQEISESDGLPVLVKHLPEWEKVRGQAVFANNHTALQAALGPRPILDLIDFVGGTEAVTAPYQAGRLLIIEYTSPQASLDADAKFQQYLASSTEDPKPVYRRIGNYNVLVFEPTDDAAANALLDQVKYEKDIQWLGEDPFLFQRLERAFVVTTTDIFISTVEVIVLGFGLSVLGGFIVGVLYFRSRDRRRLGMKEFSDAGGMIRLNLDGLTPETLPERLLKDRF
jgi:hypothetical protein